MTFKTIRLPETYQTIISITDRGFLRIEQPDCESVIELSVEQLTFIQKNVTTFLKEMSDISFQVER